MKAINIISFDVPYPANYGGVIDVFYKIKAFHTSGIKVHLHCFEYGRGKQTELEKYCESINYYKRKTEKTKLLSKLPYIVKSRISEQLKTNLLNNNYPILFEGLHCCFLLNDDNFQDRFKIVRTHNVEHDYYSSLAENESNLVRKKYFQSEAKKLQKFEPVLNFADVCLAISEKDYNYFKSTYPKVSTIHTPAFHQSDSINIKEGLGDYVLYHGNLSVNENKDAVKYIVNEIFSEINTPLIIAGLNPDKEIINLVDKHDNVKLLQNLSDNDLHKLIANAQINFLYTNQSTGLKLKLLNVLHNGRHCLVNSKMVKDSKLAECCIVLDDINAIKNELQVMMQTEITDEQISNREVLLNNYSNQHLIKALVKNITFV